MFISVFCVPCLHFCTLYLQVHTLYKPDKALGHDGQKEKQLSSSAAPPMDDDPQSH